MTSLTPELTQQLADATRRGIPLETACRLIPIGISTVREWLQVARDDATTWHTGTPISPEQKQAISALSDALTRAAAEREAEAVERIRNYTNFKGDQDWRAEAWYLEHAPTTKQRWSQQTTTIQQGQVDHTHRLVRTLDDAQLLEHLSPQTRALLAPDEA